MADDGTMQVDGAGLLAAAEAARGTEEHSSSAPTAPPAPEDAMIDAEDAPGTTGVATSAAPEGAKPEVEEAGTDSTAVQNRERADSKASSSSSSSDSSDSDDDDDDRMPADGDTLEEAQAKIKRFEGDEMDEDGNNSGSAFGPRTTNEKTPTEVALDPLPVDVKEDDNIERFGKVINKAEFRGAVVVIALPPSDDAEVNPVDIDSVICTKERKLVGRVEEVFGPVVKPFYVVRHMDVVSAGEDASQSYRVPVDEGTELYVVMRHGKHVNVAALDTRGSDASNMHDEEVDEEELDYSDDEEEMKAKQRIRAARRSQKNPNANGAKEGVPADSSPNYVIPPGNAPPSRRRGRDNHNGGNHHHSGAGRGSRRGHGNHAGRRHHNGRGGGRGGFAPPPAYPAHAAYGGGHYMYGQPPQGGFPPQAPHGHGFYPPQPQGQQAFGYGQAPNMFSGAYGPVPDMMSPQQHQQHMQHQPHMQPNYGMPQTPATPFYAQQMNYWQQPPQQQQQQQPPHAANGHSSDKMEDH